MNNEALAHIDEARISRRTAPVCRKASTAVGMRAVTRSDMRTDVDGTVSEIIRVEVTRDDGLVVWFDDIGALPAKAVQSVLGRDRGMPKATARGIELQRFTSGDRRSATVTGNGTTITIEPEEYDLLLATIAWFENRVAA